MKNRRSGFSVLELLITAAVLSVILGVAFALFRFARVSTDGTLAPQVGLQFTTRIALVRFIHEIQECVEIARPGQGSTLNYFIARDKMNKILTVYTIQDPEGSTAAGRPLHSLVLHRYDFGATDPAASRRVIVQGVERVTFTTLSPGVLQIHLRVHEKGKSYTLLTAVRARNVLQEGKL